MDKKDYLEKMEYILNDQSTYKKLNKDSTRQLTSRINLLIKSWRDNGLIDETTYKYLNTTNGNLPRCYGLPKIHKTGFSLRIIVSSLSSPLYNISKYIHDISLNSNLQPRSHVKDDWSFAIDIKDKLINDDKIISLDFTTLFTNIPKELVLRAIEKRWNDIAPNTKFNLSQFLYAVEIILDWTSSSFNGKFYEQIFDSPMGSPLSPILADIVMDDLETHCLGLLSFAVPVYYRYVDDIFAIVPRVKVDEINVIFNSYHQRLKFTHEIDVIRSDGKIVTNWYKKPTCSIRYINFYSNNSFKYKINTIFNLVAILLSDDQFHGKNINVVKQILLNNCFLTHVINRYIYKRLNFLKHQVNSVPGNMKVVQTNLPTFLALPFVEGLSDDTGRMFKNMGFTVVYNVSKKLNSLIKRGKDGLPISNRTEVVYKIITKRHLSIRVKEHFNNIKMHANNLSVISKHKLEFNHDFDWSVPDILHNEKHLRKREIAEMFFIKKFDNTINSQKYTENLNNIYDKLIKVVK
ncbi:hypothetical protein ACFW04_006535 [Cataglyphis niger]